MSTGDENTALVARALNRLAKWRSVLAGWQLGTRASDDPECQAVRDHRELTLIMRAELTALTYLLLERHVFLLKQFQQVVAREADLLSEAPARKFPGFTASDSGIEMNATIAADTMRDWRP